MEISKRNIQNISQTLIKSKDHNGNSYYIWKLSIDFVASMDPSAYTEIYDRMKEKLADNGVLTTAFSPLTAKVEPLDEILYDCSSPRPEEAGTHNMILFGKPDDKLYAYHLPLFAGEVQGMSGFVLKHVYQAVWNVELDEMTKEKYDDKFEEKKTEVSSFPLFSIGPEGEPFKVPEMICNPNFSLNAKTVYGHIENNPDFPSPEELVINQLSKISVKGETVFARRFDSSSRSKLTHFIFGTPSQYYMVHYLTDDENCFDQIVAIEIESNELKGIVDRSQFLLVSVPTSEENNVVMIPEWSDQSSTNNKMKLSTLPLGKKVKVITESPLSVEADVKIVGEIYFNKNSDLWKKEKGNE